MPEKKSNDPELSKLTLAWKLCNLNNDPEPSESTLAWKMCNLNNDPAVL